MPQMVSNPHPVHRLARRSNACIDRSTPGAGKRLRCKNCRAPTPASGETGRVIGQRDTVGTAPCDPTARHARGSRLVAVDRIATSKSPPHAPGPAVSFVQGFRRWHRPPSSPRAQSPAGSSADTPVRAHSCAAPITCTGCMGQPDRDRTFPQSASSDARETVRAILALVQRHGPVRADPAPLRLMRFFGLSKRRQQLRLPPPAIPPPPFANTIASARGPLQNPQNHCEAPTGSSV